MADYIVSVDAGNGGTNAVLSQKKGYKSTYFPSVRAAATGDSLGLGSQLELEYEYVDWAGHRYVVGDDVLRISRKGIERHQGAFRYGDEFHQFLVSVAIAQLGIKEGKIDLTLFAPPGMYNEARETMQKRFTEKSGKVALQFKSDKQPRMWSYESVNVFPEGIGAAACFVLDEKGRPVESEILSGETVILDMGMHTLDALHMQDGNFNPESLSTATWENSGIKAHILDPVLRSIKKQGEDYDLLTTDDMDAVLRNGILNDDYTMRIAGLELNTRKLFDKYAERYSEWVGNNIVEGVFNGLRGFKGAILVGGGAVVTEQYLAGYYPDKILRFSNNKTTKGIDPVFANAVGGLRLAKMRQLNPA